MSGLPGGAVNAPTTGEDETATDGEDPAVTDEAATAEEETVEP